MVYWERLHCVIGIIVGENGCRGPFVVLVCVTTVEYSCQTVSVSSLTLELREIFVSTILSIQNGLATLRILGNLGTAQPSHTSRYKSLTCFEAPCAVIPQAVEDVIQDTFYKKSKQ